MKAQDLDLMTEVFVLPSEIVQCAAEFINSLEPQPSRDTAYLMFIQLLSDFQTWNVQGESLRRLH